LFDAAAQLAVSASERADRLGLTRERRAELADMLRALVAPSGCAPDWVKRAEEAMRAAPAPPPPEVSEVHGETFAGDDATAEDAARPRDDDDDDDARLAFLRGFDDVLQLGSSPSSHATFGDGRPSRTGATEDASVSSRTTFLAADDAAAVPSATRRRPALRPSSVERLFKDVARYATESLRAHARLLDAETFRRRVAFDERRQKSDQPAGDEKSATRRATKKTRASTIETLSILTAAALEAPPRVSAAARDAAAAAIRLGRAVAEFSDDAEDIEDVARGLREYVSAALDAHPTALAEVRACLATTFLAAPFRALPPFPKTWSC
jgi:E3 ubiquitin-protein ligase UBR4